VVKRKIEWYVRYSAGLLSLLTVGTTTYAQNDRSILLIASDAERSACVSACKRLGLPYETADSFDANKDYRPYQAVLCGSNKMDYWGASDTRKPEAFANVNKFVVGGGHLLVFGSWNGRNMEHLQRYGITTGVLHCWSFAPVPEITDVFFKGSENLLPSDHKLRSVGSLSCTGDYTPLLQRAGNQANGGPAMVTLAEGKGRITVCLVEPSWAESADSPASMWLFDVTLNWLARGCPTSAAVASKSPMPEAQTPQVPQPVSAPTVKDQSKQITSGAIGIKPLVAGQRQPLASVTKTGSSAAAAYAAALSEFTETFKQRPEFVAAQRAFDDTNLQVAAARTTVTAKLKDDPQYIAALKAETDARNKLDQIRANNGDRDQIAAQAQRILDASSVPERLEAAALANDHVYQTALDKLAVAKAALKSQTDALAAAIAKDPDLALMKQAADHEQAIIVQRKSAIASINKQIAAIQQKIASVRSRMNDGSSEEDHLRMEIGLLLNKGDMIRNMTPSEYDRYLHGNAERNVGGTSRNVAPATQVSGDQPEQMAQQRKSAVNACRGVLRKVKELVQNFHPSNDSQLQKALDQLHSDVQHATEDAKTKLDGLDLLAKDETDAARVKLLKAMLDTLPATLDLARNSNAQVGDTWADQKLQSLFEEGITKFVAGSQELNEYIEKCATEWHEK